MEKQPNKAPQELKTPWYKTALFPWILIAIMAAGVLGVITGWQLHAGAQRDAQAHPITAETVRKFTNN